MKRRTCLFWSILLISTPLISQNVFFRGTSGDGTCAVDAVYLFLGLSKKSVPYTKIHAILSEKKSPAGISMLAVMDCLEAFGLKTEGILVEKTQSMNLRGLGIVLVERKGVQHFLVVKWLANGVLLYDPSLGGDPVFKVHDDFNASWSGKALLTK